MIQCLKEFQVSTLFLTIFLNIDRSLESGPG